MADPCLSDDELTARLAARPAWRLVDGRLRRELAFGDFAAAFAFMPRVALAAERLDHHPDWSNSWNRVVVDISSHAAGGVTDRCFALADAVDVAAG